MSKLAAQAGLAVALLVTSWFGMMAVHELGHVLSAVATGGSVVAVDLHPARFSSTYVDPNPSPVLVASGGPVLGCLIPLAGWLAIRRAAFQWNYLVQCFAGFCLIVNGVYIGLGWIGSVGDAGDLIRLGASRWLMSVCGATAIVAGFWCWHRLGPRMGIPDDPKLAWRHTLALVVMLVALAAAEASTGCWNPR